MSSGVAASTRAFFSFPEVTDPGRHHDYNAWHQLDHLPENLALPGVLHGERWVCTAECREVSGGDDPTLSAAQYVAMYWFREPAVPSIEEWSELGDTTLQQGRRPELAWTERRLTGFFRPVRGDATVAAGVGAAVLPWRPARGVVLEVHRVDEPGTAVTNAGLGVLRERERTAVRSLPGVLGTWTFSSRSVSLRPVGAGIPGVSDPGRLRIALHYCDGDPLAVAASIVEQDLPDPVGLTTLLRTPLLRIVPWQWDWFDGPGGPAPAGHR